MPHKYPIPMSHSDVSIAYFLTQLLSRNTISAHVDRARNSRSDCPGHPPLLFPYSTPRHRSTCASLSRYDCIASARLGSRCASLRVLTRVWAGRRMEEHRGRSAQGRHCQVRQESVVRNKCHVLRACSKLTMNVYTLGRAFRRCLSARRRSNARRAGTSGSTRPSRRRNGQRRVLMIHARSVRNPLTRQQRV